MPTTQPINLLRLDLDKELRTVAHKLFGAKLQKEEDGTFLIVGITPGSRSAKADLRKGDVILAIDNKPSAEIALDAALKLLDKRPSVILDVSRNGATSIVYVKP